MRASLVDSRPDDDFGYQVASRVFYDPQGADGADDSLQNYIQAVSYGQASISGIVFPTVRSADADVTGAAMDWLPSGHGDTHLLAVLPHAFGAHRGRLGVVGCRPTQRHHGIRHGRVVRRSESDASPVDRRVGDGDVAHGHRIR
jgi:hypothetical protein